MPKVTRHDLEACVGTPRKACGRPADPGIQGHDGKWRCRQCHKIHVELVYQEAGNSQVNASDGDHMRSVVPDDLGKSMRRARRQGALPQSLARAEIERRRGMIARYGSSGGSTIANPYSRGAPARADEVEAASRQVLDDAATRRERILAKYGAR